MDRTYTYKRLYNGHTMKDDSQDRKECRRTCRYLTVDRSIADSLNPADTTHTYKLGCTH